jgi:hypothetical protein
VGSILLLVLGVPHPNATPPLLQIRGVVTSATNPQVPTVRVTDVLNGGADLVGETISVRLEPSTEVRWVGDDNVASGTRIEASLRQAGESGSNFVAVDALLDNARLTPFRS